MENRVGTLAIVVLCAASVGCSGQDAPSSTSIVEPLQAATPKQAPVPAAVLSLSNGHTVEFYKLGGRALVSETGAAYSAPVVTHAMMRMALPDLWKQLAPGSPVPSAVTDMQAETDSPTPPKGYTPANATTSPPASGGVLRAAASPTTAATTIHPDAPVGCNNGCCDYSWLSTFGACTGGSDYSWFLYNYGWSWVNVGDVQDAYTFVCAAEQSTWNINISGSGGIWTIPAATWRTYDYHAGNTFWSDGDITSSVNTASEPHLHAYCGLAYYDVW
jgi:hypothetical protein